MACFRAVSEPFFLHLLALPVPVHYTEAQNRVKSRCRPALSRTLPFCTISERLFAPPAAQRGRENPPAVPSSRVGSAFRAPSRSGGVRDGPTAAGGWAGSGP